MKIFLLDCESPISLQFLRFYANVKEINVICGTSSTFPIVVFSRFRRKIYFYPKTNYPYVFSRKRIKKFVEIIEKIVKNENIKYILPQSESTLLPLLIHSRLRKYIPLPSISIINILHDKKKLYNALIDFSPKYFKIPQLYPSGKHMKFPIVIKPRCGAGGKFVTIIKNEKELKKKLNSLQRKFILQEFIPSKLKLTLNLFISKEGKIARILSFRKINSIKFNGIMEELERFFQKIGYFGFASPQFLIYKNQPFLLEINPRLSYYYYGVDFGVRLYEAFHQNLIKGESVRKKIKILKFPPPLSYATKIYFKETKDILPIFLMYSFATLSSLGII